MTLLTLILSSPTENATSRMRAWRALKTAGAAILRDGVYLLPERVSCRSVLQSVADDVVADGGAAYIFRIEEAESENLITLFDRNESYAKLLADIARIRTALTADTALNTIKQVRKLRKIFISLTEIDFFPGAAQQQTDTAIQDLERATARALTADEPQPVEGEICRLSIGDYQNRIWATRRRPWIDRLASGWLIRRFIDPSARILWLAAPADCPPDVLGFDFDGATFSHVGTRVTFEVLLLGFGLESPALRRLGMLIHYLDVGGVQPSEAAGVESVLGGLRETILDDDRLLAVAGSVFDGLLGNFEKEITTL